MSSSDRKSLEMVNRTNKRQSPSFKESKIYVLDNNAQHNNSNERQSGTQSNIEFLGENDPYVTSFVCLLAPRFEEHLLTGDLSDQLHIWMKDICISFGWKLHFLEIKPNYLHWIMSVSISEYPTQFMNIVCQATSKTIFDEFPRLERKNMSREFWAPWYFVGIGKAPYSQNSIQSFIRQIRMEQGLH